MDINTPRLPDVIFGSCDDGSGSPTTPCLEMSLETSTPEGQGRTTLRRVTDELMVLAAPAILHRDALHTVWHAGVVQGPSGAVVFTLQIDSPHERRFRDDPDWRLRNLSRFFGHWVVSSSVVGWVRRVG